MFLNFIIASLLDLYYFHKLLVKQNMQRGDYYDKTRII
jgi:hypothetical protein